jgi:transposase
MKRTPSRPQSWHEGRRLRAFQLKQDGWKQCDIATALGVSEGAVSQWMQRARQGGATALRHTPAPGPSTRLESWQRLALCEMLSVGAEAFGFRGQVWTGRRVTALIAHTLGIGYHPGHVTRLLKQWGFTLQKPQQQAGQHDQAVIDQWRAETWPALKKKLRLKNGPSSV